MSILGLFDIGKSAIFASQAALNTTHHNIANVNTPGFSRQEVILKVASPVLGKGGYIGRGVTIAGIKRHYDRFIQSQLLIMQQNYGRSYVLDRTLSQIEQLFNEANTTGLSGALSDYFSSWQDVAANPEERIPRTVLLQKANFLVNVAKQMERGINDSLRYINEEIENNAEQVNSIASEIASLNDKIMQIEVGNSQEANDLRDQRDNLLKELSNLIDFTSYENEDGFVNVMVGMRNLVSGERTNKLSAQMNVDGNIELYLDGLNITDNIERGQIGGLIDVSADIESNSLYGLRKLIASITKEINILHRQGYGLDTTTGNDFFNPLQVSARDYSSGADITAAISDLSQLTLDEYNVQFDAANNYYVYNKQSGALVTSGAYVSGNTITFDGIDIVITGAVTSTDTFSVSPLTDAVKNFGVAITDYNKIAASSSNTTLPGDNTNALLISQLSENSISNLGSTFSDYYGGVVSDIGTMSKAASDSLKFDDNLLTELQNRREAISGVSLDEEAVNLVRFQRYFEAGAKMIKVTDELLQTIINL